MTFYPQYHVDCSNDYINGFYEGAAETTNLLMLVDTFFGTNEKWERHKTTLPQMVSLVRLWQRHLSEKRKVLEELPSLDAFLEVIHTERGKVEDTLIVIHNGMYIGIERDGYTHS